MNGDDALRLGLISDLVEPDQLLAAADALVDRMLTFSATALRLTKVAVDAPMEAHPQVDLLAQAVLFEDPEKFARMAAFVDRSRRPKN